MPSKTAASVLAWLLVIASAAFAAGSSNDARRADGCAPPSALPAPVFETVAEIHADDGGDQPWELLASKLDDASRPENSVAVSKSPVVDRAENIRLDRTANKAIHLTKASCLPDMYDQGRTSRRPVSGCATPSLAVTMPITRSPPPSMFSPL